MCDFCFGFGVPFICTKVQLIIMLNNHCMLCQRHFPFLFLIVYCGRWWKSLPLGTKTILAVLAHMMCGMIFRFSSGISSESRMQLVLLNRFIDFELVSRPSSMYITLIRSILMSVIRITAQ